MREKVVQKLSQNGCTNIISLLGTTKLNRHPKCGVKIMVLIE